MDENEIGKEFMLRTQYHFLSPSEQSKGLPAPSLEIPYESKEALDLPSPKQIEVQKIDLRDAIEKRRSIRKYSDQPLSLEDLSYLLWCTQGIKEIYPNATIRTVPSAGARHAFETFLMVNRVEGLQKGVYRFLAIPHKLSVVSLSPDVHARILKACLQQSIVETSAVTFLWVAVASRMKWRYGERGYRYLHLDAGHVGQNLYLAGESVDCGVCAIGAYLDGDLNSTLGLDGEELFVIYIATVGKRER